jgi:ATP-dependent Clp protease adapter protein ClpS
MIAGSVFKNRATTFDCFPAFFMQKNQSNQKEYFPTDRNKPTDAQALVESLSIKKDAQLLFSPAPSLFSISQVTISPLEDEDVLIDDDIGTRIGHPWKVILFNDDIHTFDEVILQLQKAIGCSAQKAEQIAFEAHTKGKALAFSGEFNECYRVAGVLREIQLIVEIEG